MKSEIKKLQDLGANVEEVKDFNLISSFGDGM